MRLGSCTYVDYKMGNLGNKTAGLEWKVNDSIYILFLFRLLAQRKVQPSATSSDAGSDEIITDLSYSQER